MPHIDDPLLQAYVDGVCNDARVREVEDHLQDCASCRERLEQARGAATRAHELLATLDPGPVHAPAFEELQARAAARAADASGAPSQASAVDRRSGTSSATPADSGVGTAGAAPGRAAPPAPAIDPSVFATPRKQRRRTPLWRSPVLAWAATVVIAFLLGWLSHPGVVVLGPEPGAERIERFAPAPSETAAGEAAAPPGQPGAAGERDDAAAKTTMSADAAETVDPPVAPPVGEQGAGADVGRELAEAALRARRQEEQEARRSETAPAATRADGRRGATADLTTLPATPAGEVAAAAAPAPAESNEAFVDTMPVAPSVAPGFVPISRDAVVAFLGTEPRILPGLAMLRAEVAPGGLVEGGIAQRFAVRMIYLPPSGEEIALVQQYVGPLEGLESISSAEPEAVGDAVANAAARAERERDALALRAGGATPAMPMDLDAAVDALDLPATSRDPDGRVTHRWRDGDYVLAISAMLDADVVRGLADRVR